MIGTGIENVNEYYTNHYMAAILSTDVRPFIQKLQDEGGGDDESEDAPTPLPWRRLGAQQRELFSIRDRLERRHSARDRVELHRGMAKALLVALGYEVEPTHQLIAGGWLPLLGAWKRADGSPLLWIVPVASGSAERGVEGTGDLLARPLLPEQHGIDPDPPEDLNVKALAGRTAEDLVTAAFGLEDAPRFVLVVGDTEWVLADRSKWPEQRMLRFDWAELLGRRDIETLKAVTALLHRDALVPAAGTPLVDMLDESSHKHAHGVSEDLKYALRECIERIGNEAIRYRRQVSKKGVFKAEIDGQELAIECIRYMYRLLFLLYVEARPELGYAPMGEPSYERGYSFERLRDLDMVELDTDEERNGFYIHECLQKLFEMVYEGTEALRQTQLQYRDEDDAGDPSLHHTFRLVPLRSHLFDPEKTPLLSTVRMRNEVLLEIIKAMSLSRAGGKAKQRGRISYATLGINQLGEVYEALLSFRGFFAEEKLYEVKPASVSTPDPISDVAYFVPERDLGQYRKDERVFDAAGDVQAYEKGTFIYRMAGRDREKSASYYTPEVLTKCLVKYALKELLEDEEGRPKYAKAEDLLMLTICEPAMGSAAFLNEAINQIAERYLQARQQELGERISHERYMEELQRVRMYLADNCVYGVDLNPLAVELAEVSLWLNAIFAESTKAGREVFVPWFGGQLTCGNSLVGAWRKVFPGSTLAAGKDGDQVAWLDAVPERVPLGTARGKGSVHHFLLPDRGMATYGEGTEGKPIRDGWKKELDKIDAWRKAACRPLSKEDIKALVRLAEAIDGLWEKHTELLRSIRERTTDPLSVYGHPHRLVGKAPTTTEDKDRIWRKEMASEQVRASSPYRRLKLAMDYWCALWFWPIEKADSLPDREEWLADLAMLLEPGVLPGLKGGEDQRELFASTMAADAARTLVDEVGFADVEKVIERSERLRLADELAKNYRFLHWELEYADVFVNRGGFDLVLGNPPWVPIRWAERHVLAEADPLFVIRDFSATETAARRESVWRKKSFTSIYSHAHEEAEGLQGALASRHLYPDLGGGIRTNLYKCFVVLSWAIGAPNGVEGMLHPDGVYDDPNGGALRRRLYPRLRRHYQLQNAHTLFPIAHRFRYSVNVYGHSRVPVKFVHLANVFLPVTIDECHCHDGSGPVPGIKDDGDNWDVRGHRARLIKVSESELELFAQLYDESGTPAIEARLPALHSEELVAALRVISRAPKRLGDLTREQYFTTSQFHETHAQRDGVIRRDVQFPDSADGWVVSGPHFFVGNPFYKTPRAVCTEKGHYDVLDLSELPEDYLPRTIYVPNVDASEYRARSPKVSWETGGAPSVTSDYYRVIVPAMIGPDGERTLQPAIIPPGPAHIDTVCAWGFRDTALVAEVAGVWCSLPVDFLVKSMGATKFRANLATQMPIQAEFSSSVRLRVCLLVCLTRLYADLWRECFDEGWRDETAALTVPGAYAGSFRGLEPSWCAKYPLRTAASRRGALVELDVLVAMSLGLTIGQLQSIYKVQFPVLRSYESDTWYDANGRIIFTNSRGLTGVGIPRSRSAAYPSGPYWSDVALFSEEAGYTGSATVTQIVEDDTLPGGPRQKIITYQAPWVRCNREHDYAVVWKHFEDRFGKRSPR